MSVWYVRYNIYALAGRGEEMMVDVLQYVRKCENKWKQMGMDFNASSDGDDDNDDDSYRKFLTKVYFCVVCEVLIFSCLLKTFL